MKYVKPDDAVETPKVVDLKRFRKKQPECVWECPCGSQLFYLQGDGAIQCRGCEHIMEALQWTYRDA